MADAPKKIVADTQAIIDAWGELAKSATFAGLTLDQFKAAVQPSFDSRNKIAALETDLDAEQVNRAKVDGVTVKTNADVVKAVVGDKNFGDDSALYERMGYVRKSNRASGLTRKSKAPAPSTDKK